MPLATHWPLTESFRGIKSLHANGSDNPGPSPTGDQAPNGIEGRLEIVPDPTGVRGNVMRSTLYETDADTASHKRSEIAGYAETLSEYWHSWKMMLSPDWTDYKSPFILMQIHDTPDVDDGIVKTPNYLVCVIDGHFRVIVPGETLPAETNVFLRQSGYKIESGRWYDFCVHTNWATNVTGFREMFIDGIRVVYEFSLPTQYTDIIGPYLKLGVYDGLSASAGWVSRRAYYSDIRIWEGAATHRDGLNRDKANPLRITTV